MAKRQRQTDRATASSSIAQARRIVLNGMPRALGIRFVSLSRRKVTAEMPITKRLHISLGARVYGGAIMAFADVTGAAGAVANLPPGYRTGTIESKTNFLIAADGPVLRAVSIPLHIGRATMVWQTTVKNASGRTVAVVTQTQFVMPD